MDSSDRTTEQQIEGKSILIVDDDMFLLDMYATRFTQAKFKVSTAMNAGEVLTKLRAGLNPEIILLDVVMPGVDGFELLESINAEALVPSAIKIYLTNLGQDQDIDRGKSLGAKGYIVKATSTPSEVVAHVESIIHNHAI